MDPADYGLLVLKLRGFGCDQTKYHFFVRAYLCERSEATGTLIVIFQIEGINVFLGENIICNGVIRTAGKEGRVVVSAADVRVDHHVGRFCFQRQIVDFQKFGLYVVQIKTESTVTQFGSIAYDCAPGTVIELEVAASGFIKLTDHVLVSDTDVMDQFFVGRIELSGAFQV